MKLHTRYDDFGFEIAPRRNWPFQKHWRLYNRKSMERGFTSTRRVREMGRAFIEEIGWCEECGITENLTIDHIVPAIFLKSFGYDPDREFRIEWIQCLCEGCNKKKSGKIILSDYRTRAIIRDIFKEKGYPEITA